MHVLGVDPLWPGEPVTAEWIGSPNFKEACTAIMLEGAEIVDEINTLSKPWKRKPIEDTVENIRTELIDVIFYVLEIMAMLGMTESDLVRLYEEKLNKNFHRVIGSEFSTDRQVELAKMYLEGLEKIEVE